MQAMHYVCCHVRICSTAGLQIPYCEDVKTQSIRLPEHYAASPDNTEIVDEGTGKGMQYLVVFASRVANGLGWS